MLSQRSKHSERVSQRKTSRSRSPLREPRRSLRARSRSRSPPPEIELDSLRQLLSGYRPAYLVDKLVEFMTVVVQDDICLARKSHGDNPQDRLHDILCNFMYAYVPVPIGDQLAHHGALINGKPRLGGGVNGNVFFSGEFEQNPMVTKSSIKYTEQYFTELYINMVVINSLLLSGIETNHLVATYGLFVCPFQEGSKGKQICVPSRPGKQMDGKPNLLMVQKQIKGWTLFDIIHAEQEREIQKTYIPVLDLEQVLAILKQVLTTLLWLELSPYQLYHNDLHIDNIMVEEETGSAYIIDFGFAECTIDSVRTQYSPVKRIYCGSKEIAGELQTGAYDIYMLLYGLMQSHDLEIYEYAGARLERFCSYFRTSYDVETETYSNHLPFSHWKTKKPWLYAILSEIEGVLGEEERRYVHHYNMNLLEQMTYSQLCIWLFNEEEMEDWETLMDTIIATYP